MKREVAIAESAFDADRKSLRHAIELCNQHAFFTGPAS
jgi:hypothetical protein